MLETVRLLRSDKTHWVTGPDPSDRQTGETFIAGTFQTVRQCTVNFTAHLPCRVSVGPCTSPSKPLGRDSVHCSNGMKPGVTSLSYVQAQPPTSLPPSFVPLEIKSSLNSKILKPDTELVNWHGNTSRF